MENIKEYIEAKPNKAVTSIDVTKKKIDYNPSFKLYRDFSRDDFPENCILVTHGLAIKLFIMRFFHLTVEEFEMMLSPKNCDLIVLEQTPEGTYTLKTPLKKSDTQPNYHRPITI